MNLTQKQYDDNYVACFPYETVINSENAREFKKQLKQRLMQANYQLILDGTNLQFIDSSGISAIISCLKIALQHNGYIRFIQLSGQVLNVFTLIKLDKMLPIYMTLAEAVEAK